MKVPKFPDDRVDLNYKPNGNLLGFGVFLILLSLFIGGLSSYLPKDFPIEPIVALAFGYFLLGIYILILQKNG